MTDSGKTYALSGAGHHVGSGLSVKRDYSHDSRSIENHEQLPDSIDASACSCASHAFKTWYEREYSSVKRRDAAEQAWATCATRLRQHDEGIVKVWKEEIDSLLVFAGLFSAALTAFNVELYTALKPDGNEAPPTSSVWINALWFSSLILSLSSASIGIIVRQWLHQFISPASPDPRRSAEIHHSRYELGIIRWKVPEILNILPILLLAALMLFFIGLAILLSTLNFAVAILCTAMISILFIFFAVTTIAPTFWFDCPYKSPQALMAYWFLQYVYGSFIVRLLRAFLHQAYSNLKPKKQNRGNITRKPERFPKICRDLIALCSKLRVLLIHYVEQHSHHNDICDNWKALEQSALERHSSHQRESEAKSAGSVTADVLTSASAALIDDTFLSEVIHPCILDPSCEIDDASLILQRVAKAIPVASFSGSEFSTLALAHHTRVAAEQSHRDIPQFRLLQMQYYYRSNEEAKAALINWANTACDTRLAVGAIVQLMTEYMIEPFRDDRLALPHDTVMKFLHRASQMLVTDCYDQFSLMACAAALLFVASSSETCYKNHYRMLTWKMLEGLCRHYPNMAYGNSGSWPYVSKYVVFLIRNHEQSELRSRGDTEVHALLKQHTHVQDALFERFWGHLDLAELCTWPMTVQAYRDGLLRLRKNHERRTAFITWVEMCSENVDLTCMTRGDTANMNLSIAAALSQLICEIRNPISDSRLELSRNKIPFFIEYAREELQRQQSDDAQGALAVAILLCAHAPTALYRERYSETLWDMIGKFCRDWSRPTALQGRSRLCILMQISFLLEKHEPGHASQTAATDNDHTPGPRFSLSTLRSLGGALRGKVVTAEYLREWPSMVNRYPYSSVRQQAFVSCAIACLHGPDISCLDSDVDDASAAVLAELMFFIKEPFYHEELALVPHEKVLFLLQYAVRQLERQDVDDKAMCACAVTLLICASSPHTDYQRHYRARVWNLIDATFACVASKSLWVDDSIRRCVRDHILDLLRQQEHSDLREDLGFCLLSFLGQQHLSAAHREWAMEIRDILQDHLDSYASDMRLPGSDAYPLGCT